MHRARVQDVSNIARNALAMPLPDLDADAESADGAKAGRDGDGLAEDRSWRDKVRRVPPPPPSSPSADDGLGGVGR